MGDQEVEIKVSKESNEIPSQKKYAEEIDVFDESKPVSAYLSDPFKHKGVHRAHGLAYVHNAFRRDIVLILRELQKVSNIQDVAYLNDIKDWWFHMDKCLHHHHKTEDELFFPAVSTDYPETKAFFDLKLQEHVEMDKLKDSFETNLKNLCKDEGSKEEREEMFSKAKKDLKLFWDHVNEHFTSEEDVIFPMFIAKQNLEWQKKFDKKRIESTPKAQLADDLCYILNANTTQNAQYFLNNYLPFVPRKLYGWVWKGNYNKKAPRLYQKSLIDNKL